MITKKLEIKVFRQEELQKDVEFQVVGVKGQTTTFGKGEVVDANYTATISADFSADGYNDPKLFRDIAQVENTMSALFMLYGHKILDKKFLQSKLKKFVPEIPCTLIDVKRKYETYTRTGRGGRFDYATETEDLLSEKTTERNL